MKRELLICICALTLVASITDSIYACCEKPVANFSAPNSVTICEVVNFSGSSSYDPDNTVIHTYSWDFGSGACDIDSSSNLPNASCKYSTAGDKTVTLTVTDNDNPDCCGGTPDCNDKTSDPYSLTITVVAPTGEDSTFIRWDGPAAGFKGQLTPTADDFSGLSVEEVDGGDGWDDCWFAGSQYPKFDYLTGGSWDIIANNWYQFCDWLNFGLGRISYYRTHPAGNPSAPCSAGITQCMVVDCPCSDDNDGCPCSVDEYTNHPLINTIGPMNITNERDGVSASRTYP